MTVAAARLTVGENAGGTHLDWDADASIPDSPQNTAAGRLAAKIISPEIQSTRFNASGYRLFRVSGALRLETAERESRATAACTVVVPNRAVLGRTPGKRASYPLPSEDLVSQDVPEGAIVHFGAKGTDLVNVEVQDGVSRFTDAPGVKVEWAPYREGEQTWDWVLTAVPRPGRVVRLDFATMWRTTAKPAASIRCSVEEGTERVVARTSGSL